MNLNELFNHEFTNSGTLIVYDSFSTDFQFSISGKPKNYISDIGIVIQGGVGNNETLQLIKQAIYRYKLSYPNSKIIISTWNNIDELYIESLAEAARNYDDVFLMLNRPPDYAGSSNCNMQITSTINGARFAKEKGVKYILKTRTDQLFGDFLFIDQLLTLHKTFREKLPDSQQGRIVVGSMGSFRARPFCVSDFFAFGFTDDIITMWNLELATPNKTPRKIIVRPRSEKDKHPITEEHMDHFNFVTNKSRCGEGYYTSNLLYNSGRCYSYDWSDSENFLASCFIVADTCSLGLVWPKYGMTSSYSKYKSGHAWGPTFARSPHGMHEITFTKWLEFYNKYLEE